MRETHEAGMTARMALTLLGALGCRFVAIFILFVMIGSSDRKFDGIGQGSILMALAWQLANYLERLED